MMNSRNVWSVGMMAVACAVLSACSSIPQTTRTAAIHDISITDALKNDNLVVQPGDEIRWVDLRKDTGTCRYPQSGCGRFGLPARLLQLDGAAQETAELGENETASLCFKKAQIINYNVRAETALGGGMKILPGTVRIDNAMPK